jgi:hypothetical protein
MGRTCVARESTATAGAGVEDTAGAVDTAVDDDVDVAAADTVMLPELTFK